MSDEKPPSERLLTFSVTLHAQAKVVETNEGYHLTLGSVHMGTLGTLSGADVPDEVRQVMGAKARTLALKYALDSVSGKHEAQQPWTPGEGAKA